MNIKHTGIFMPVDQVNQVKSLVPSVEQVTSNISIFNPGKMEDATRIIDAYAKEQGLPDLEPTFHYGLLSNGELVAEGE